MVTAPASAGRVPSNGIETPPERAAGVVQSHSRMILEGGIRGEQSHALAVSKQRMPPAELPDIAGEGTATSPMSEGI